MIDGNDWFTEYQMLSNDEREVYKEYILDEEQKALVLDYERFKKAIELMASKPNDLWIKCSNRVNIAEEVALIFDDECVYIAPYLKKERCISEQIYNMVIEVNEQLTLLSNEHNEKNWTIQAMNSDKRWIKARALADKIYKLLINVGENNVMVLR